MIKMQSLRNNSSGYTLLQMAMSLMILGIMTAGFIQVYNVYKQQQDYSENQRVVEDAVQKLQTYRQAYGFYPCPAPIDSLRNDALYGRASNCLDTTQAVGACAGGLCTQSFTRLIDADNNPLTPDVATPVRVRVGTVPFRDLQMDEKDTFDPYGSRLTYALTENMGSITTFKELQGGINIVDEQGQPQVEPAGSASFVVLSHGPNRVGAVISMGGNQPVACTAAASLDVENCVDPAAPPAAATFLNSYRADGAGAGQFDDVVQYFASASNPLWRRVSLTSEDVTDMSDRNVGLGTFSAASPPPDELTITQTTVNTTSGNIVTTNGAGESGALRINDLHPVDGGRRLRADRYCDQTGTKCFQVKDFTGDPSLGTGGFKCPSGYMTAITSNGSNATPDCQPIRVQCPANTVMTGLLASGAPDCATVASTCPADATKTLCGAGISIAAGGDTTTQTFNYTTGGACATITYKCSGGTWGVFSGSYSSAYCTNAAVTGQSCGTGYTGTYSSNTCGGGSTFATDCTCVGTASDPTFTCSAPFTGSTKTQHCTQSCLANVLQPQVCGVMTGSCTCSKTNYYDFANCDSGKVRKASPSPASFTGPVTPWPASPLQGKYRFLTINTGTCTYDSPAYNDTNCECDNLPLYATELKSPSDYGFTPNACYVPKTGSRNVMDGATVAKTGVTYDKVVTKTTKDALCVLDPGTKVTLPDPAIFVPRPFKWKRQPGAKSNASLEATTGGYPEADDSCTCAAAGTTSACAVASGPGYDFYTCKCTGV